MVALIDDEDAERVLGIKWHTNPVTCRGRVKFYARASFRSGTYLHRLILSPEKHQLVDHINFDTLDCRRSNLRIANKSGNTAHSQRRLPVSGYRGVCKNGDGDLFYARVSWMNQTIRRRGFKTAEEAARAYDEMAREAYGDFAMLNFAPDITGDRS